MMLHRLNAGNYVTDLAEGAGSWVVYRYEDGAGRPDGWMVCNHIATENGTTLVSREWVRTLADARHYITTTDPMTGVYWYTGSEWVEIDSIDRCSFIRTT